MASAETKALIQKLGVKVVPLASDGLLRSDDVRLAGSDRVLVFSNDFAIVITEWTIIFLAGRDINLHRLCAHPESSRTHPHRARGWLVSNRRLPPAF